MMFHLALLAATNELDRGMIFFAGGTILAFQLWALDVCFAPRLKLVFWPTRPLACVPGVPTGTPRGRSCCADFAWCSGELTCWKNMKKLDRRFHIIWHFWMYHKRLWKVVLQNELSSSRELWTDKINTVNIRFWHWKNVAKGASSAQW